MKLTKIFLWSMRISAVLLFLFWVAFFFAHLLEWFIQPKKGLPPLFVWVAQFFHLIIVVGFGLMIKREKVGAIIMVIGTISFFLIIGVNKFPFIALVNILPLIFLGLYWLSLPKS